MARKRKRKIASLDGVEVKMKRAEVHRQELRKAPWETFPPFGTYKIAPEIYDEGRRHVYKAINPPTFDPKWSAVAGDCFHNLRCALDHLAVELVRLNRGEPTTSTAFPILSGPPRRKWTHRRMLPDISGGVTKVIRERLETVQPYNGGDLGQGLALLRDLDNIDKHRTLVVLAFATYGNLTTWTPGVDPEPAVANGGQYTRNPLKHGEVIAVFTFDPPQPKPDPNLTFLPYVAFDVFENKRVRGDPVDEVIRIATDHVREVINLFAPLFV